ncbi:MAG TPA: GIY-YIG nuclease family protein [Beijerinckiaceae bacterium]|jgi:putative endonuclease
MQRGGWVYILASRRNGTLYVGSATDLSRRIWEHKNKLTPGFTSEYNVMTLVWYEGYDQILEARHREYKIKRWRRAWKLALIEAMNPDWRDLYDELNQ